LFLADRGYLDLTYLRDIDRQGGSFIVRGKANLNPRVMDAYREDGQRLNPALTAASTFEPVSQNGPD
jgi:hypothetical protein